MYKYITHPESGRQVNINSYLGKDILLAYFKKANLTGESTDSEETIEDRDVVHSEVGSARRKQDQNKITNVVDPTQSIKNDGTLKTTDTNMELHQIDNDTVDEKAKRMVQKFGENTVIVKSRNVSRYQKGQKVENIGKGNNITGTIVAILESDKLTHNFFQPGKIIISTT